MREGPTLRLSVVVALSLAVASCGSGDRGADTTGSRSQATPAVTTTTKADPPTTTATTTTSGDTSTTTATTTTTTLSPGAVNLGGDGLGLVSFGDPADEALARLEAALGPPDDFLDSREDIITSDDTFFYGGPDETEVLAIWRPIGLFAAFSRYPFYREDGVLHFSGWATAPAHLGAAPLQTEAGIGVGSTYGEVKRTYGDRLVMNDSVCGPVAYVVPEVEDDRALRIGLVFENGTAEPDKAQLVALHGGASPGC